MASGDDDMGDQIHFGDITENHTHLPKPAGMSGLAKGLVAAGLAAAGIGTGIGLPIAAITAINSLKQPDPQVAPDTNTKYNLKIYRDE